MLGSRLAAQLWQTSVYTNKACRAVGAPVCFWCRGASAFICISAQACAACACARNVNVIVAGRRVPWRAGEQLCFRGPTLRCSHVRRTDKGRLAEHRTLCWCHGRRGVQGRRAPAQSADARSNGEMRALGSSETDVTAPSCPRLLHTPNPTELCRCAKSESNKIQMTDYRDLALRPEFMPLGKNHPLHLKAWQARDPRLPSLHSSDHF